MSRKDRVLGALKELYLEKVHALSETAISGISAGDVADRLGILRNNCSADLNELARSGAVTKIGGRPTCYRPADMQPILPVENAAADEPRHENPLRSLIGANHSLKEAVEKATIALRYPPHGMHVLLLGETGVGKSTFAKSMHLCAIHEGCLTAQAPFIPFNCSEYASNPEVLLDHLFGHAKGAYTGADRDRSGLVELAHGGILFLDEVHRLPAHGQEMLFHLLDSGQYQRMGESSTWRRSQVLLVAATTEPPESTLLATFRRRIPMVIELPSLRNWDIRDRFELVHKLLHHEACSTRRAYHLSAEALGSLLFAHFPANIGDLRNVLRLACANTLLNSPMSNAGEVAILRPQVHLLHNGRQDLLVRSSAAALSDIIIGPDDAQPIFPEGLHEQSLYAQLNRLTRALDELGFADDEIISSIERELSRRDGEYSRQQSLSELQRFVGESFYSVMRRCWSQIHRDAVDSQGDSAFIRITIHLYGVTHAAHQPLRDLSQRLEKLQLSHTKETALAQKLVELFYKETGIHLPKHEIAVLSVLLKQTTLQRRYTIGMILALRGMGVATRIAESALQIFPHAQIVAIDLAMDQGLHDAQRLVRQSLRQVDHGDGILVMTDFPHLAESFTLPEATGLHFVWRPDFSTVIHALQFSCTGRLSLQELVSALAGEGRKVPDSMGAKRIIWTSCMTGKGTAQALKRLIEQELPSEWRSVIEVMPIDILPGSQTSLPSSDGVVAAVGSIDPGQTGVPFLSVEELLAPEGMHRLLCLLENPGAQTKVVPSTTQADVDGAPLVTYTQSILERELLYANPLHVRTTCLRMAQRVESLIKKTLSPQWRARFLLHMGYVIERAIVHQPVIHPYATKIQKQFPKEWTILCEAWEEVESVFRLPADVNELAFVFEMVFSDPDYEVLLS